MLVIPSGAFWSTRNDGRKWGISFGRQSGGGPDCTLDLAKLVVLASVAGGRIVLGLRWVSILELSTSISPIPKTL